MSKRLLMPKTTTFPVGATRTGASIAVAAPSSGQTTVKAWPVVSRAETLMPGAERRAAENDFVFWPTSRWRKIAFLDS